MKQKILLIGNKHFLSSILESLRGTRYILENEIDIIIAQKKGGSNNSKRRLIKSLKEWKLRYVVNTLKDKLFISLNHRLFKKQIATIRDSIFADRDISYLNYLQNVSFLEYDGLNIKNLETYDFMIVASFSLKIPQEILDKPRKGTLNIHPSCLPELRGGYPSYVQAYLQMDHCSTTIHFMDEKWDHGDIVLQKSVKIDPYGTYQQRMNNSAMLAAELLNDLHNNNFEFSTEPQTHSKSTYCHKILKVKKRISRFSKDENFEGFVAANYYETLYPYTYTYYKGFIFSILKVKKMEHMKGYKQKGLFYLDGRYYFAFYGDIYLITMYIFKGKLIDFSQNHQEKSEDLVVSENAA